MAPRVAREKPVLKQSSLQFGSRKSGKAADGKAKSSTTTPTPVATTRSVPASVAEEVVHDSDIEEISAPEWEPTAMEHISEVDEPAPVTPSKRRKGKATAAKKGKGKLEDEDEIEVVEEERPKKRRRVSSRGTKASVEIAADDEAKASTSKGAKGKRKQPKGRKGLSKSVFSSREGVENSESNKAANWAAESKIKITVKGSGKTAKHVDLPALRKHFGYVREKMGNVKPSESPVLLLFPHGGRTRSTGYMHPNSRLTSSFPVHAKDQSMEDHILRFFDVYVYLI